MSDTEVDYLQPGFDYTKLTIPRLRSILVTYNVQYGGSQKKADLIGLFEEHVLPQSRKVLAARARVKRMSQGITDANSQSTSTDFDEHDLMPPPPSVSRARSPRKTTRVKQESGDVGHLTPAPRTSTRESPRKRQSRSVSTQPTITSDTDTGADVEEPKSVRRRRATPSTPAIKSELSQESDFFKRTPETEAIFSSENPFQRGSNSPPTVKTPSTRRKTTGMESILGKSTPASRRRTDIPTFDDDDDDQTLVSRSFEVPLSQVISRKTPEPPSPAFVEADEEFTPDEQLALVQEEQANPQLAAARRKHLEPSRRTNLSTPIWVLVTTLVCAYAAWYRQEKIAVGYCELGREPRRLIPSTIQLPEWATDAAAKVGLENIHTVQDINVPEWAVPFIEPQCEPCPLHAYCYEDFSTRCEQDYILQPHPLSLGGFIPLPPTCEPDGEKARRVKTIADKAVEELRDRRAKFECGDSVEPEAPPPASPAIEEQELKETLSQKRNKRMAAEEFDELWAAAIGEVKARDEVQVQVEEPQPQAADATGDTLGFPTTRLSSSSLARLSYSCAIRRQVKLGLARHRLSIGGVILSILTLLYARSSFLANRALSAQIPALVDEVLERLATQKEIAFEGGDDDAFLFLPNLRDDVLRSLHSLKQRDRLWQRVRAVVEQNSNVRTGQREGRNGEMGRAWEWIGPSRPAAVLGDGSGGGLLKSGGRRKSVARVSWGPDVKGEEQQNVSSPAADLVERRGGVVHKKWEEGRPIY